MVGNLYDSLLREENFTACYQKVTIEPASSSFFAQLQRRFKL